jgi:hypothetical protein
MGGLCIRGEKFLSKMTVKEIQKKLRKKFETHKYILENSYVYDWESDLFSVTSSGYAIEIELKTSLSDFRADFKKIDKHNILQLKAAGEKTYISKGYNTYQYEFEELQTLVIDGKRQYGDDYKPIQVPSGKIIRSRIETTDIEYFLKNKHNAKYEQISSSIYIKKVPKTPNKFYYICPTGIIPLKLVPEYAGLYYIDENMRVTEVKKAPFIHKEKEDLTRVLLDKFYYLSLNCIK